MGTVVCARRKTSGRIPSLTAFYADMSIWQMRRDIFVSSQKALFEAQDRLRERREADQKAKQEFNKMQLQLKRLDSEKITMVCMA
jgi:hypothetical protein